MALKEILKKVLDNQRVMIYSLIMASLHKIYFKNTDERVKNLLTPSSNYILPNSFNYGLGFFIF